MKIRELMQPNVVTVNEDAPAKDAFEIMCSRKFRHLIVLNKQDQLAGIVSDRDILNVAVMFKKHPTSAEECLIEDKLQVCEVMTREPATVSPDDDLGHALDLMLNLCISGLPVVENGKLVGIVTNTDFLRLLKRLSKEL